MHICYIYVCDVNPRVGKREHVQACIGDDAGVEMRFLWPRIFQIRWVGGVKEFVWRLTSMELLCIPVVSSFRAAIC